MDRWSSYELEGKGSIPLFASFSIPPANQFNKENQLYYHCRMIAGFHTEYFNQEAMLQYLAINTIPAILIAYFYGRKTKIGAVHTFILCMVLSAVAGFAIALFWDDWKVPEGDDEDDELNNRVM